MTLKKKKNPDNQRKMVLLNFIIFLIIFLYNKNLSYILMLF